MSSKDSERATLRDNKIGDKNDAEHKKITVVQHAKRRNLLIETAYELTPQGVMALDFSEQFLALDGISETEIQKRVRDLITKQLHEENL